MRRSLLALVTLLATLGLLALTPAPSSATETRPDWGSTTGHDAKVRKGCRGYTYDYTITPPYEYWAVETFLVGPDGQTKGSGYLLSGADPLTGQGSFRLCRRNTPRGTYTIRAQLTATDGFDEVVGWLPESTFHLKVKKRRR